MEEKALLWKSRWEEVCELGEKENFKVIITLQPLLGVGNKVLTDWELRNVKELPDQNPISTYLPMQDQLKDLEKKCTATADLTDIFDDETVEKKLIILKLKQYITKKRPKDVSYQKYQKKNLILI